MAVKKKSSFEEAVEVPVKGGFRGFLLIKLLLIVVAVVGVGVGIYYYFEYDKAQKMLKNPTLSAQVEQKSLVDRVGKLIELPKDEDPTIATVSDVSKLKDQPFFAKAKNGFKVLIYPKNKKAILYDPVSNKLVEVGPINIGEQANTTSPAVIQSPVSVILYNGTKTVGYASSVEKQLDEKAPNVTVLSKGNARLDYKKTIVVDLGLEGSKKEAASQLANLLGGEVGSLPKGETKPASPAADFLVILGKE